MDNSSSLQIIMGFGLAFTLLDFITGSLRKAGAFTLNEIGVNIFSFINFMAVRTVMIVFYAWALVWCFPTAEGFLSGFGFWWVFLGYVLVEEYVHYWIHRFSHRIPWLWRLHKPHHVPQHVNLSVAYRENWLWFVVVPNPLFTAILVWGGQPEAAFAAAAWKGSSEFMVHSNTRWDLKLHRFWLTKPLMRVLEKIITLPDTHHAHHGIGRYGHGMCNFGSFLFIFDIIHGTAEIPRQVQDRFGVPDRVKVEPWYEQLWWPVAKDGSAADLKPPRKLESQGITITGADGKFSITM